MFGTETLPGSLILKAAAKGARAVGMRVVVSNRYQGTCDWLCIYAASQNSRRAIWGTHLTRGKLAAGWDHGYFGRDIDPDKRYMRVSVNHLHPQNWLSKTPPTPGRWEAHGISLRNDYDPNGHIILAGIGGFSRARKALYKWEWRTVESLRNRFPNRRIVYRPKPGVVTEQNFGCERDERPIAEVLKGASLLVCQHSNVALDACVAGIPVECDDGAARWLYCNGSNPSPKQRLDFLRRACWWQWRCYETTDAWSFLTRVCK